MLVVTLNSNAVLPGLGSTSINPATFTGTGSIEFGASSSGTVIVGFRLGANVGWFALDLGGVGGAIHYLEGRYGSMGEIVHVPAPGALALGAAGVRRNRARTA